MNNYNLWRQELFNIIYISINANTKMIYCSISTLAINAISLYVYIHITHIIYIYYIYYIYIYIYIYSNIFSNQLSSHTDPSMVPIHNYFCNLLMFWSKDSKTPCFSFSAFQNELASDSKVKSCFSSASRIYFPISY